MATSLRLVEQPTITAEMHAERRLLERAVAGRYRVLDLISRGGMGAVYRAWEHGLERHVAIKLLSPARSRDAEDRGRFRREARILASLNHPGIVTVLAIGEQNDACWFAMPLLTGGTLAARFGREERCTPAETRELLVQLADAVSFAHQHGVVHRDLKAENICLDERGRAVITDFGVATLRTSDHSRSEITKGMGTARYMPPEQILGSPDSDARADVYAMGVLGFRLLTGRFPFDGTDAQIAAQHLSQDVPPVTAYAADAPVALAAVIDRCLARKPQRRWKSAAALHEALENADVRRAQKTRTRNGYQFLVRVLRARISYASLVRFVTRPPAPVA